MPIVSESTELDCGMEGEPTEAVTIGRFNRFILKILRGHIKPIHENLEELSAWKSELDLMLKVVKKMLWLLIAVVVGTAGSTLWVMQYIITQLKLGS
jgi:hypothetical protein